MWDLARGSWTAAWWQHAPQVLSRLKPEEHLRKRSSISEQVGKANPTPTVSDIVFTTLALWSSKSYSSPVSVFCEEHLKTQESWNMAERKKPKRQNQKSLLAKRGVHLVSECEMLLLRNVMDSPQPDFEISLCTSLWTGWGMEPRLITIYLYLMYGLLLKVVLCSVWQFLQETKIPDIELPTWGILLVFRSFLFCISVLIVTSSHQESHTNCAATYTRTSFASFCLLSVPVFTATTMALCPRSPSQQSFPSCTKNE